MMDTLILVNDCNDTQMWNTNTLPSAFPQSIDQIICQDAVATNERIAPGKSQTENVGIVMEKP